MYGDIMYTEIMKMKLSIERNESNVDTKVHVDVDVVAADVVAVNGVYVSLVVSIDYFA